MTVSYRFTEETRQDWKEFDEEPKKEILDKVDEAAEDHFYNSEYYSKFYDHHGRIWDKLNFAIKGEPIKAVFIEGDEFLIIFIASHEDFKYDTDLYNLMQKRSK